MKKDGLSKVPKSSSSTNGEGSSLVNVNIFHTYSLIKGEFHTTT